MANIKRTKDLKQLEKNKMTDMHALPKWALQDWSFSTRRNKNKEDTLAISLEE